jgi:hypothetical protein
MHPIRKTIFFPVLTLVRRLTGKTALEPVAKASTDEEGFFDVTAPERLLPAGGAAGFSGLTAGGGGREGLGNSRHTH